MNRGAHAVARLAGNRPAGRPVRGGRAWVTTVDDRSPSPDPPPDDRTAQYLRDQGLPTEFTMLLSRAADGDDAARDEVFACSYERLRAIAGNLARSLPVGSELQATAIVSEAFLRLERAGIRADNRRHFLGLAATSMRSVLVDFCRRRDRQKRRPADGGVVHSYDEQLDAQAARAFDPIELDEALEQLQQHDPALVEVVHLRFFLSMTVPEVGEVLGVSVSTVERRFREARDWLRARML